MHSLQVGLRRRLDVGLAVSEQTIRLTRPEGLIREQMGFPAAQMRQSLGDLEAGLPLAQAGFHRLADADVWIDFENRRRLPLTLPLLRPAPPTHTPPSSPP